LEHFPSGKDGKDAPGKNTTGFPWQRDVPIRKLMSLIETMPDLNVFKKKGRRNVPRSLQPTPEAAKSRLARLRRKQLMLRLDRKRATLTPQNATFPPGSLGP
jgi:hypothetical protein